MVNHFQSLTTENTEKGLCVLRDFVVHHRVVIAPVITIGSMDAGIQRFRPIILTTFFGLMPMILETSRQARFLIPMAISLGFGILFATGIKLLLIPSAHPDPRRPWPAREAEIGRSLPLEVCFPFLPQSGKLSCNNFRE